MEFIGRRRVPFDAPINRAAVSRISEIRRLVEKRRPRTKGRDAFSRGWTQLAKRRSGARKVERSHRATRVHETTVFLGRGRSLWYGRDNFRSGQRAGGRHRTWIARRYLGLLSREVATISIESESRWKKQRRALTRISRTFVEFADRVNGFAFSRRVFDS